MKYIWLHVIIIHQPEMLGDLKDFKGLAAEDNPATDRIYGVDPPIGDHHLTAAFYVGWLDGLLGPGSLLIIICYYIWIIPENSLRKTHQ